MKGIIIGGGIGGLTLAVAMQQLDLEATVYEAAPKIREVGAGILLGVNAMLVLKALGLHQKVQAAGKVMIQGQITDPGYKLLQALPFKAMEEKFGLSSVLIHRAKLQSILLQELSDTTIKTNHKAIELLEGDQPIIKFENNTQIVADFIIGADGINSVIRQQLFPESRPRYSGQTCWRGMVEYQLPTHLKKVVTEIWGRKGRFGFAEIEENVVYWYAVKKAPQGEKDSAEFIMNELLDTFEDFGEPVQDIIVSTILSTIIRNDLSDIKPMKKWHKGNICLLGDAIHATTPNLGQGGAQSIEDGLALARCLKNNTSINTAFENFKRIRYAKASFVVNQSRLVGQIAHLDSSFLTWARNAIMPMVPQKRIIQQFERLYTLNY